MMPELSGGATGPLLLLVLAGVAVNALSAYLAYRLTRSLGAPVGEQARDADRGQSAGGGHGDVTIECRECGTGNDPDYRYCRECVAELPGAIGFERSGSGPAGRMVR